LEEKNLLKKAQELLLLFTVALAPLAFSTHTADPFWAVEMFFFKFAVTALCILYLIRVFNDEQLTVFKTPYNIALAGFMLVNLAGMLVAKNMFSFFSTVYTNGCYIMLFYFTLDFVSDEEKNLKKMLAAVIAPAALMAAYGMFQSFGIDFVPWQTNFSFRAASTLGNPNFLAGHMVLVIPVVYAFLPDADKRKKLGMVLIALLLTAALGFSQTRGAYIAYLVSMTVFLVMLLKYDSENMKKYSRGILVFFLVVAVSGAVYFSVNKNARERIVSMVSLKDREADIRTKLWKNTLYMIKDSFLLGSGAGNFPGKYSYYQSRSLNAGYFKDAEYYRTGHAHNDFLQFIAEYGVIGAGFMFLFLGLIFYNGIRALNRGTENKYFSIGVIAAEAGILTHGFFNFPFIIIPTTAVFYALSASALVTQDDYDFEEKETGKGARWAALAGAAMLIVPLVIVTQALLSNAYLRQAKEHDYFKRPEKAVLFASRALVIDPWNEENFYFSGFTREKSGDMEGAFADYRKVFEMNPGNWEANVGLYAYYAAKNMPAEALAAGENLYRISPFSLRAVMALGYANYISGMYAGAVDLYVKALETWPDNYELLYHLSAVYGATGDTEKAAVYAQRAITASKDNQGAYYNLAVAYYKAGNKVKAITVLNSMLKEHPGDERALELLKAVKK
jgi:O-antigen ligase/cytochrome c-type biogenesis protein CcmH/NrfG